MDGPPVLTWQCVLESLTSEYTLISTKRERFPIKFAPLHFVLVVLLRNN